MADFLHTPAALSQHVLEREGCPLHYWLGGPPTQPLLLFMHGATMDHRMFNAQVEALVPAYRVLVWDARGHGRSQPMGAGFSLAQCAQDLLAILDQEGIETAVVGGQSLGGYIAQYLYQLAPQRVQAMVIIGSTPIAKAYSRLEIGVLKATMPLFHLWPYTHFSQMVARNTAMTPAVRDYARSAISQISRDNFLTIWKAVTLAIDHKGQPGWHIEVPLLLQQGEHDNTGTIKRDMPPWAAAEPKATYCMVPAAGHNANQDNAPFTNQALLDFLQQHGI